MLDIRGKTNLGSLENSDSISCVAARIAIVLHSAHVATQRNRVHMYKKQRYWRSL